MLSFGLEISETKGISSFLQYHFECIISNINFSRGALFSTATGGLKSSGLLGCYTVPPSKHLSIYHRTILLSSFRLGSPGRVDCLTLKIKAIQSFKAIF
jgi:hypothetical protein